MIVYFYERKSETLYDWSEPALSRSRISIPYMVSNGYAVFVPDIVYESGHPGKSAYNCIISGTESVCRQFPCIDSNRLGIDGQSWGGYQSLYLITQTDIFKAAGAGAPVSNMTSAYEGIEMFSALRRLGSPVWMLQYRGEGHNLTRRSNKKDLTVRMTEFFGHYLKGEPMPEWMKTTD